MLSKKHLLGQITILEDGQLQIREDTIIEEDRVEISRLFHRRVVAPTPDLPSQEFARVRAVANAIWTPEVIEEHQRRRQAEQNARTPLNRV